MKYILHLCTCFLLVICFESCETIKGMPDNAFLLLDESKNEYYSPPCLMKTGYDNEDKIYEFAWFTKLKVIRASELIIDKHVPNSECRDNYGLVQMNDKERWNNNGTWKY